jgi:hypothetical protein
VTCKVSVCQGLGGRFRLAANPLFSGSNPFAASSPFRRFDPIATFVPSWWNDRPDQDSRQGSTLICSASSCDLQWLDSVDIFLDGRQGRGRNRPDSEGRQQPKRSPGSGARRRGWELREKLDLLSVLGDPQGQTGERRFDRLPFAAGPRHDQSFGLGMTEPELQWKRM